jgi:tetratricopeptide (TPR) repeat protein
LTSLQIELAEGEYARTVSRSASNLKALKSFWRGEHHAIRYVKEGNALARQWAEKAIELDPEFAGAWSLLGWTHLLDARNGWSESPMRSWELAEQSARKAITLDDSLPKTIALLSFIYLVKERNYDQAIKYNKRAVDFGPNDGHVLAGSGEIMFWVGRYEESITRLRKIIGFARYPIPYQLMLLGYGNFHLGRYDEAISIFTQLLERCQKGECPVEWAHTGLAAVCSNLGQTAESQAQVAQILKLNPKFSLESLSMYWLYKNPADKERVLEALRKAGLPE